MPRREKIKIECKNKTLEEIATEVEKKTRKKPNAKVMFVNYPSRWERSPGLRGAMRIAGILGAILAFSGEKNRKPLDEFIKNLEEIGLENHGDYIYLAYKIAALQPSGVLFNVRHLDPGKSSPTLYGYPDEALKEILDENELKKLETLLDLEVVKTKNQVGSDNYYILTEKGKEIVNYYIETKLESKVIETIEDITSEIDERLIFSYLHSESLGKIDKAYPDLGYVYNDLSRLFTNRAMEFSFLSSESLIGKITDISSRNNLTIDELKEDEGDVITQIRRFWDILEESALAVRAPIIETSIYMNPKKSVKMNEFDNFQQIKEVYGDYVIADYEQRTIPIELAEKISNIIIQKLPEDEDKIIRVLMMVSKYRDSPKLVKEKIWKENNSYNLLKDDLDILESIVYLLSEKGITSDYSDSGDIPFIVKDKTALDEFLTDYLLGKEDIEL